MGVPNYVPNYGGVYARVNSGGEKWTPIVQKNPPKNGCPKFFASVYKAPAVTPNTAVVYDCN
jgi:hypothetical protein